MSKTHGMGAGLLVGGYNVSGDIGSLQRIASPRTVLDHTDITQSAFERKLALKDGGIDFNAFLTTDAGRIHDALSDLPRTDQVATYLHRQSTQNTIVAAMVAKQINYDPNRTQDGDLIIGVSLVSNGFGLEWGNLLSEGIQTLSGASNSASVDHGAGTAFGLQAYLQVIAFTGTSVTFTIQGSSDNAVGDPFANITGAAFTAVSAAPAAERIQTARNAAIERYLRVAATGTFSSVVYALAVVRNTIEVNF
jgi:hypothetical protein